MLQAFALALAKATTLAKAKARTVAKCGVWNPLSGLDAFAGW